MQNTPNLPISKERFKKARRVFIANHPDVYNELALIINFAVTSWDMNPSSEIFSKKLAEKVVQYIKANKRKFGLEEK